LEQLAEVQDNLGDKRSERACGTLVERASVVGQHEAKARTHLFVKRYSSLTGPGWIALSPVIACAQNLFSMGFVGVWDTGPIDTTPANSPKFTTLSRIYADPT
jgi:hypothetical protein